MIMKAIVTDKHLSYSTDIRSETAYSVGILLLEMGYKLVTLKYRGALSTYLSISKCAVLGVVWMAF